MNQQDRDMKNDDTPQNDITEEVIPEEPAPKPSPTRPAQEAAEEGYQTRRRHGLGNAARAISGEGGRTTMFHPGAMVDESTGEVVPTAASGDSAAADFDQSGTQIVTGAPRPPRLTLKNSPYFLVIGAPPGEERLSILHARTTFGRDKGDIQLRDPAISSLHFQIDVVGREFFIRDLGSRNGTQLNGYPVRYNEILPGDEVRAGETVLVFRTEEDGLADRRKSHT